MKLKDQLIRVLKRPMRGDVYEVPIRDQKVFIQYVMNDSSLFNANLIRVFELRIDKDTVVDANVIVMGDVKFYVHTMIIGGIKLCGWRKIGNATIEKDFVPPMFRTTVDFGSNVKSRNWEIWTAGEPRIKIGSMKTKYELLPFGAGHHPIDIVRWMDTGIYPFANLE